MKRFNLISILILFFSLLNIQSVVGQTEIDGVYYLIYDEAEHDLGYNINTPHLEQSIADYPAQAYFEAKRGSSAITDFRITFQCYVNNSWNNTKTINAGKGTYQSSNWFNIPNNTTKIRIYRHEGSVKRWVKNIKVRIAPHTKLNPSSPSLSFNTAVTDEETQNIDFYSFLSGDNGIQISIVDENGNQITIEGLSLSKTSIAANTLEKIGENNHSFTLKFKPEQIITNATCSIKIENLRAEVNPIIYIPVTLNSTPEVPTLKLDASGYTFAKLSWNPIEGAESYNIYDNGTKVENNITFNGTTATITGLAYGSNHSYTITSVVGSAESNKSGAVTVNCPAYPQIQNVHFTDVQQNQVTVNWNPITNLPANHIVVRYHVHFYENAAGTGTIGIGKTTTETSYTFTGLTDNTKYTAYVDVEYQYTLNGETKNVHEERWSSASITTTSFIPTTPFDGEKMYKGEWYRVLVNSTKTLVTPSSVISSATGTYTFPLNYPCENLKYEAWLSASADNSHTISDDATKNNKNLADEDYKIGDRYTLQTTSIDISTTQVVFTGNRVWNGDKGIYLDNIWAKIAPHIKMKEKSVDFMFNLTDEGPGEIKNVEFHSFLATNKLECTLVNKDDSPYTDNYFELLETEKLNTITPNTLSIVDETTYNFKVKFNPAANVDGYYYARIKITDGTSTEYVDLSGYKYNLNLQWDQELPKELTVDEPFTLIADTYDDNGGGPIATEIYVTYEWEPEDAFSIIYPENAKEAYPIITPQRSCESATITAYKKGNIYYNSSNTIIKTIVKIKQAEQTLNWEDFELTTADKDITITGNLCQSTKADLLNRIGETITYSSSNSNVVEISGNTLTVLKYGEEVTITASQAGKVGYIDAAESKSVTITPKIGTIQFDNNGGNKNWNNSANWLPINTLNTQRNVEPSVIVNAKIAAEAEISSTNREEINDLTFVENGKLTINATSGLKANKITNDDADKLILESSISGNATLIYADGTPSATVEMYSKAQYGTTATDGHHPEWQYVGVAVNGATVGDFEYNNEKSAWLLKWDEAENVTGDPWTDAPLADNTTLVPWAGYSISQPTTKTYSLKGTLCKGNQPNGDHTYTLTRTTKEGAEKQDPDCGFNLLANSYTAPIDITKLTTDDFKNADACIILYNTGTFADWESQTGTLGQNPGQLTVIPVNSAQATGLPTTIPSMQAFFVKANEGGGMFTVDYNKTVAGATNMNNQMRAPQARDEFNVLKIMIEGENSRDRLFLLENENTSDKYDNGYEASKIFDAPQGHQMYATCEYGYASINCSESFVGQTIGLKGDSEGEQLTISFDTEGLEGYSSLYLYDKVTGDYVNIIAGEEYTFYGIRRADDNRFTIVTNPDDRNQTPPFVVIGEELAFDKSQIATDNTNIYIYDAVGRLLITDKVNPSENYRIPDMPNGIYLVSLNGYTTKIVKK